MIQEMPDFPRHFMYICFIQSRKIINPHLSLSRDRSSCESNCWNLPSDANPLPVPCRVFQHVRTPSSIWRNSEIKPILDLDHQLKIVEMFSVQNITFRNRFLLSGNFQRWMNITWKRTNRKRMNVGEELWSGRCFSSKLVDSVYHCCVMLFAIWLNQCFFINTH